MAKKYNVIFFLQTKLLVLYQIIVVRGIKHHVLNISLDVSVM